MTRWNTAEYMVYTTTQGSTMRNRHNTINGTIHSKEAVYYAAHGKTQRIHNNGEHSEYLAHHKENTEEHIENTKHGGPYICSVKCSPT